MLISDTEKYNLPICEGNPNRSLLSTLHSFMTVRYYKRIIFYECVNICEL